MAVITLDQAPDDHGFHPEPGGGGVSMVLVWAKINRRKWLIAVLSAALFGLFTVILVNLPVWYTVEAEIVVEQRPQGVDLAAVLSRIPTDSQAVLTEAEALRSRALVQRTINQLGLLANPEFNPRIIPADGSLSRLVEMKARIVSCVRSLLFGGPRPVTDAEILNDAVSSFLKRLSVGPVGRSQVLRATFTSKSPELASRILNTLIGLYLSTQMDNRVAVPTKVGDFLKGELDRLQAKVRDSNDAVERYRSQAMLQKSLVQGRETLLATQELSQATTELMTTRLKRQEAEARLAEIRLNPSAFPDVLASPAIQQVRQQLSALNDTRSQLIASYGTSYPKLKEVAASVADAESRLRTEVAKVSRSLASDAAVQAARETQLSQTVGDLNKQIEDSANARVSLAALEQEADVNRSILTTFLTQYRQLASQRALQIADSYVLAGADVPTVPSFPPLIPFLALSAVVSVALSTCVALALERTGQAIRSPHEVQLLLAARSLAVIPKIRSGADVPAQVIDRPESQFTESIRSILSRFTPKGSRGRAIMVTSARFGEGRTSLAIALGRQAALSGLRVVLVDADLRRPAVHVALRSQIGPGLTDLLEHRLEPGKATCKDLATPLRYITSGQVAPHSANLLCLPGMANLIERLRAEFDLVILDSPASGVVADARILAQLADDFLFVVTWNKTPWRLVREQLADLSQHNRSLAGVILNQVDMRKQSRHHAGYHELAEPPPMIGTAG